MVQLNSQNAIALVALRCHAVPSLTNEETLSVVDRVPAVCVFRGPFALSLRGCRPLQQLSGKTIE